MDHSIRSIENFTRPSQVAIFSASCEGFFCGYRCRIRTDQTKCRAHARSRKHEPGRICSRARIDFALHRAQNVTTHKDLRDDNFFPINAASARVHQSTGNFLPAQKKEANGPESLLSDSRVHSARQEIHLSDDDLQLSVRAVTNCNDCNRKITAIVSAVIWNLIS